MTEKNYCFRSFEAPLGHLVLQPIAASSVMKFQIVDVGGALGRPCRVSRHRQAYRRKGSRILAEPLCKRLGAVRNNRLSRITSQGILLAASS